MDSRGVQFFRGTAKRCRRSKCPSWRAEATVRPRRQGRVVGVHRSEEESLDGRGGRIRRRIESGRAMGHEVESPTTRKEKVSYRRVRHRVCHRQALVEQRRFLR
jgi:hypothetical protein